MTHTPLSEISITEAANVMSAMEFIQCAIFFLGILHLQRKVYSVAGSQAKTQCKISDYTVQVTNIPSNTRDVNILQHFSDLYALDKHDWVGRPPVVRAEVRGCVVYVVIWLYGMCIYVMCMSLPLPLTQSLLVCLSCLCL
jgi:hypothetical protein